MPYSEGIYSIDCKDLTRLATPEELKANAPFKTIQALRDFLRPRVIELVEGADENVYIHLDDATLNTVNTYIEREVPPQSVPTLLAGHKSQSSINVQTLQFLNDLRDYQEKREWDDQRN